MTKVESGTQEYVGPIYVTDDGDSAARSMAASDPLRRRTAFRRRAGDGG
ncbi:MAG: hypothetical protein ABR500_15430 [Dermatophilaceae bacterium]|nr:hypothetical protein [Intrasporangiaceae bacterium]